MRADLRRKLAALLVLSLTMPLHAEAQRARPPGAVENLFAEFRGEAPGASVLVVWNGRTVLRGSFGLASMEDGTKASAKTTYRLASVSKQFTAAAILMLVERKELSLDDSISKIFPDFPAYGFAIQVRHLLNHTSGLLAYEELMRKESTEAVVDADVLDLLRKQDRTYFPPGSRFRYSNSGYAVLACIVERVSQMPYPEFLAKTIFKPLGMKRTFLTRRDQLTGGGRAFGYSRRDDAWVKTDQSRTSFVLGDGGIYASLEDLEKWERALDRASILKRQTLEQAMTATTAATGEGSTGYGYGWYVGRHGDYAAVWHSGSTIGFRNMYLRIPEKRLTVIVLTNRNDADAVGLARKVADLYVNGTVACLGK